MADRNEDDVDRDVEFFLRNQALLYGDSALSLMLYHMSSAEVIQWLKDQIELLEDHG